MQIFYRHHHLHRPVLMFNHLFVSDSESRFLIDADNEDLDWQETAEACGIPVIRIADSTEVTKSAVDEGAGRDHS